MVDLAHQTHKKSATHNQVVGIPRHLSHGSVKDANMPPAQTLEHDSSSDENESGSEFHCSGTGSDLETERQTVDVAASVSQARQEKEGKYASVDSEELHKILARVDPTSAQRLHPKNRRKVVR
jgi:hypothetical protein